MRAFGPAVVVAAGVVLVAAAAAPSAERQTPVVVVPGLGLGDLEALAHTPNVAVGLLVPDAGPETSATRARAALVRGEVRNSLRDGLPAGPPLIELARRQPSGDRIVVGLPVGGRQRNDRRYPVAVVGPGYDGLLTSHSTRIPGLVSVADIAPTALSDPDRLGSTLSSDPLGELRELDRRISDNGDARLPAGLLAAALLVALAVVRPRAGPLGLFAALTANLALGVAGISTPWFVVAAIGVAVVAGGLLLARAIPSSVGVAVVGVAVIAAYLLAMALDATWVALSPLGPTQNSRFYGISNLLETMLLVPALVAAAFLARRFGLVAVAAVAALALVTVAGSRFGADGGGAIVLAAGFAVLAAALLGGRRRALAAILLGAGAALAVLALDAVLGPATHVGESLRGGPDEVARDLAERLSLSFRRATAHWGVFVAVVGAVTALAVLAARLPRLDLGREGRALLLGFVAAIAVSLVVNDSPVDVSLWGLVGYLVLERGAARGDPHARKYNFGDPSEGALRP